MKVAPASQVVMRLDGHLSSGALSRAGSMSGAEQLQARSMAGSDILHGTAAASAAPEVMQDEVLENERSLPFKGFKANHLMALDPRRCACALHTWLYPQIAVWTAAFRVKR